jgi:hypothetical protein
MMNDILRVVIYTLIILALPINLYVTYCLMYLSFKNRGIPALAERAMVSATLTTVSMIGMVFVILRIAGLPLEPNSVLILNGLSAILVSAPAVYWAYMYRKDGFDKHG